MNESGRHLVSVGYRISQPLWQIENHSASLCCVTHLGSWQQNAQIKEFPFVRQLQIAAVVLFVTDKLWRNWMGAGLLLIQNHSTQKTYWNKQNNVRFNTDKHFHQNDVWRAVLICCLHKYRRCFLYISYWVCTVWSAAFMCFNPP